MVNRTVLSPHHVRVIGLPTAIPSKLSTLNATAWTCMAKKRPAANMDRRVNDQNMMNERDKECRRLWILMLSMLIAGCAGQEFSKGHCVGMYSNV